VQCGFCTPGIMVRSVSVLDRGNGLDATRWRGALSGHLCRCTGYGRIFDAVAAAAAGWESGELPHGDVPRRPVVFAAARPAPSGAVGASAPRYRGVEYALGAKPFIADMRVEGMLHGAVVLAAHPRARVLAIDPAPALALPGVARRGHGRGRAGRAPRRHHRPRLAGVRRGRRNDALRRRRDRAGGCRLAVPRAPCRRGGGGQLRGARAVTSPAEALRPDAPRVHEAGNVLDVCAFARGDVDTALAASAHVVAERFQTQRVEHAFLEPEACLAIPVDSRQSTADSASAHSSAREPTVPSCQLPTVNRRLAARAVKVYSQGQGVHEDQAQIAAVLGVERAAVDVELVATAAPSAARRTCRSRRRPPSRR